MAFETMTSDEINALTNGASKVATRRTKKNAFMQHVPTFMNAELDAVLPYKVSDKDYVLDKRTNEMSLWTLKASFTRAAKYAQRSIEMEEIVTKDDQVYVLIRITSSPVTVRSAEQDTEQDTEQDPAPAPAPKRK